MVAADLMTFDTSRFPLVTLVLPSRMTAVSVASLTAGFEQLFARRSKFIVIADIRPMQHVPDALSRRALTDALSLPAFRDMQHRYQLGSANILESAPIRAALTAVLWVWSPSVPMYAASSMQDAEAWCLARLADAGVMMQDQARRA